MEGAPAILQKDLMTATEVEGGLSVFLEYFGGAVLRFSILHHDLPNEEPDFYFYAGAQKQQK